MKNNEDNSINTLLDVVSKLRDPKSGCPWDLKQTLDSIAPFSIEEAYEVVEAVQENDTHKIIEELGDLLFQIVLLLGQTSYQNPAPQNAFLRIALKTNPQRHL